MDEHKIIKTENLTLHDLPLFNANWSQVSDFALSFDPVAEIGEFSWPDVALSFSNSSSVREIRSYLCFTQRWWNNKTRNISDSALEEMRSAIVLLRSKFLNK